MEKTFLPIVRAEKLDSFLEKWRDWLVLSKDIEEQKFPGKLKPEFSSTDAEMIALAPKSYICYDFENNRSKDGRKGIPNHLTLELEEFRQVLYNSQEHFVNVNSLRLNKNKEMVRTSTHKRGLTSINTKFRIESDLIETKPLRNRDNQLL